MGWTKWFSGVGSDGTPNETKYKVSTDKRDGSTRHERLTREPGADTHSHDIHRTSQDRANSTTIHVEDKPNSPRTK